MKIGITCYPTYGGSGAVATELGIGLSERGHEVHFISYAQPFRLAGFRERVYFHEVEMQSYPLFEHPPYTLALAAAIHDTVIREELDIIHVHYAVPHATSAWIAREMLEARGGPPLVTTLHGTDVTLVGLQPTFRAITCFSIRRSQGITAVSEFLKDVTVRDFQISADRIKVIPNFVNTEVFSRNRTRCHRAALAPHGEKIVMHVSNFRPVKRVTDVIEVFAAVRRAAPARLVMVGDGPDRPLAAARAEALDVADSVVFLGKHASVEELLACADLFLLTSESESFGLAALEAMSCGVPVVGYQVGGLGEVVGHGRSGYLVPAGRVDDAIDAAVDVLRDQSRWASMSSQARAIAEERFALDRVLPLYEAYYREVLAADAGVPVGATAMLAGDPR